MGRFCHSFLLAVRVHFTLSGRVTHRDLGSPHSTGKGPQNHARGVTHLSRCPCRAFFQGSKGQLHVAEQGKCKQTQRSRIWSGRLHFPRDGQQGWDSVGFTSWHSKATQVLLESGRGMARATVTILGSRTHAFPFHGDKGAVSICLLLPLQGQA